MTEQRCGPAASRCIIVERSEIENFTKVIWIADSRVGVAIGTILLRIVQQGLSIPTDTGHVEDIVPHLR